MLKFDENRWKNTFRGVELRVEMHSAVFVMRKIVENTRVKVEILWSEIMLKSRISCNYSKCVRTEDSIVSSLVDGTDHTNR